MNKKIAIIKTHIEYDVVNSSPVIVFTDINGIEWVHEEQTSNFGGYITALIEKSKSWYFKSNSKEVGE